jgi:hypothetical protein
LDFCAPSVLSEPVFWIRIISGGLIRNRGISRIWTRLKSIAGSGSALYLKTTEGHYDEQDPHQSEKSGQQNWSEQMSQARCLFSEILLCFSVWIQAILKSEIGYDTLYSFFVNSERKNTGPAIQVRYTVQSDSLIIGFFVHRLANNKKTRICQMHLS